MRRERVAWPGGAFRITERRDNRLVHTLGVHDGDLLFGRHEGGRFGAGAQSWGGEDAGMAIDDHGGTIAASLLRGKW
jgi:hypothetical protein